MNRAGLGAAMLMALALLGVLALQPDATPHEVTSPQPDEAADAAPALIGAPAPPPATGEQYVAPGPDDPVAEEQDELEVDAPPVSVRGRILLSGDLRVTTASVQAYSLRGDEAPTFAEMGLRPIVLPMLKILGERGTYEGRLAAGRYLLALTLRGSTHPVAEAIVEIGKVVVEQDLRADIDLDPFLPVLLFDADGKSLTEDVTFRIEALDPRVITHGKPAMVLQRDDDVIFVRPPPFLSKTNRPVNMQGRALVLAVTSTRYGRREHRVTLPRRDPLVVRFEPPVRVRVRLENLPRPLQYASHVTMWQRSDQNIGHVTFSRMLAARPKKDGGYLFDPLQPGEYEARLFLMASPWRLADGKVQGSLEPATIEHFRIEVTRATEEVVLRVPKLHTVSLRGAADDEGPLAIFRIREDGASWAHSTLYRHSNYTAYMLTPGRYRVQSVKHKDRHWSLQVPAQTELRLDGDE